MDQLRKRQLRQDGCREVLDLWHAAAEEERREDDVDEESRHSPHLIGYGHGNVFAETRDEQKAEKPADDRTRKIQPLK